MADAPRSWVVAADLGGRYDVQVVQTAKAADAGEAAAKQGGWPSGQIVALSIQLLDHAAKRLLS